MSRSRKSTGKAPCGKLRLFQQGDVLLHEVSSVPSGLKPMTQEIPGLFLLAKGEVTGHHHSVAIEEPAKLFTDANNDIWLMASAPTTIKHQEHKPVTVPAGKYKIGRVQEVDPFTDEISSVRD